MTVLTIDAGNTRIKWGLFDAQGTLLEQGACLHGELEHKTLPTADVAIISNVAGNGIENVLKKQLSHCPDVRWLISTKSACGVTNLYTSPEKLGTDRWAGLIATWHAHQGACVVVNAGTAVTIDALDGLGQFLGGMILPGLDLMQLSLHRATAQLPQNGMPQQAHSPFATNTNDAIAAGALYAISGAISQMALALHAQGNQRPALVLSGGNAAIISQHLQADVTTPAVIVDNLVLQGLFLLATNDKKRNA